MNKYRADLHNHTVLSPCGDIDMSPTWMVNTAREKGLDILGVTDHNSTLQSRQLYQIAAGKSPYILCGAEITTKEEVHCLAFAEYGEPLDKLQEFLDDHLPKIPNQEEIFGYQLLVDKDDNVIDQLEYLLISALDVSIDDIELFVHSLGGIFIPAHIDKQANSIISQLGFIPPTLACEALEFSKRADIEDFLSKNKYINKMDLQYIRSSDAHYPSDFCSVATEFYMEELSFNEIKLALKGVEGRYVKPIN